MNWHDLTSLYPGAVLEPQTWACDCHTPRTSKGEQILTGRMYPTKVNAEGLCLSCDHYAYRISKRVLSLSNQRASGLKYKMKIAT